LSRGKLQLGKVMLLAIHLEQGVERIIPVITLGVSFVDPRQEERSE
jgi:hypothetical protein